MFEHHVPGEVDSDDEEEVEKHIPVHDAIRALELLHVFDSQQEVPTLTELGIVQILEHLRRRLLSQRLIRLGGKPTNNTHILSGPGLMSPPGQLQVTSTVTEFAEETANFDTCRAEI